VPGGPRVAIVGGSLGGLITALRLRDAGCDVTVFERSRTPLEGRGAGIVLHPVTTRFFEEHRLFDLERVSSSTRTLRYLTSDGGVLLEEPIFYRFTSYATLHGALVTSLEPERYRLDVECVGFEQDADGVEVVAADGARHRADLLVGADGIHSTIRGLLFPTVEPAYAGYVAWRGTLPEVLVPPRSRAGLGGALTYFVTPGTHALSYLIPPVGGDERHLNWVWYRNVDRDALDDLLTDRRGVRQTMSLAAGHVRDVFVEALHRSAPRELPPPFADLVLATPEPFVQVVVDIEVPRMAVGRVCLVGDAAFALRPHIAAGTAKVAADAAALADAIRARQGVLQALATWEPGQLEVGRRALARTKDVGDRVQKHGTFRPGDPDVAFGLFEPKDSNFPEPGA
jgi:2,6-dihydroxypyridine 3-monooxygenase